MANIDIRDLFEIEQETTGDSFIKTIKQELITYNVYFDEDIGQPSKYRDLINLLYVCSPDTEFNFFINTSGGSLSSALAIIEGIKATEANVRAILNGECHSAGSIIGLNCHEVVVSDSAFMLIHTANFGSDGNTHNVKSHVDFSTKMINKILDSTYNGFLSELELTEVKKGCELWIDADEIKKRLLARIAHLEKKTTVSTKPSKKSPKTVPSKE